MAWLLRVTLRTVEKASLYGQLFQYIPEFYVETVTKAMYALHSYFHPIVNIEELEGKAMPLKLSNEFFLCMKYFSYNEVINGKVLFL